MEYLKNAKVLSLKQYVQIIKVYLGIFVAEWMIISNPTCLVLNGPDGFKLPTILSDYLFLNLRKANH